MHNAKIAVEILSESEDGASAKSLYLEALTLVERFRRRLVNVIENEFDRMGRSDVSDQRALMLFNVV